MNIKQLKCTDCKYKNICKYMDIMAKLNEELKEIKTVVKEPFSISLNCRHYGKEVPNPRVRQVEM